MCVCVCVSLVWLVHANTRGHGDGRYMPWHDHMYAYHHGHGRVCISSMPALCMVHTRLPNCNSAKGAKLICGAVTCLAGPDLRGAWYCRPEWCVVFLIGTCHSRAQILGAGDPIPKNCRPHGSWFLEHDRKNVYGKSIDDSKRHHRQM